MLNQTRQTKTQGFTLVELMVVVAIIGILSSVAISNYRKYQSRARQTEAKIALSAGYTGEQSYFASEGTFTACLEAVGSIIYVPPSVRRYYTVGWDNFASDCGPTGTGDCWGYVWNNDGTVKTLCSHAVYTLASNAVANASLTVYHDARDLSPYGGGVVRQTVFTMAAAGSISSTAATLDYWSVDQNKNLVNSNDGI